LRGVQWHATDEEERSDIRHHFGRNLEVNVIPNVPRLPLPANSVIRKEAGILKLVYFSLISRKKNLSFLLDLLANLSIPGVTLDIVGPVKDHDYWLECLPMVERSNGTIRYLGDRSPLEVNELLSNYHFFVLPTNGENFGHAIMESMSTWRPVMISEHTPWKDIQPFRGGFSIPLVTSRWEDKLKEARNWSQSEFDAACVGAMGYFCTKINMSGLRSMYLSLFKATS
jgi:glycosyltransferase involved in cell wall biosynthesis